MNHNTQKIALASDHAAYHLKETLKTHLRKAGFEVVDYGTDSEQAVDYPDYVMPAAASVAAGGSDLGIVLGGSGNGEAMAANRFRGVRCALCWDTESARLAKQHNDANMISIGARMVSEQEAVDIAETWLNTEFEGGRHARRIAKLDRDAG